MSGRKRDGQFIRLFEPSGKGMTLIEAIVASSVISAAFLLAFTTIQLTSKHLEFETIAADQQLLTRQTLDTMMDELRALRGSLADFNTQTALRNDTIAGTSGAQDSLRFRTVFYDEAARQVVNGQDVTYRWTLSPVEIAGNGEDDDGNGLADDDDGRIERLVGTQVMQVLCDHVPRSGFLILKQGRRLQITVGRTNRTGVQTGDGTNFNTTVTQVTYFLRNG